MLRLIVYQNESNFTSFSFEVERQGGPSFYNYRKIWLTPLLSSDRLNWPTSSLARPQPGHPPHITEQIKSHCEIEPGNMKQFYEMLSTISLH